MTLSENLKIVAALTPRQTKAATALVGAIIDRANYERTLFVITLGTLVAADVDGAVLLEESAASDMTGSNEVADADMVGATPEASAGFVQTDDNAIKMLEYRGMKRYVRLTITPANNTDAIDIAAVAILWRGRLAPPA